MTTDEMIQQAIKELQGQVAIGDIVAHPSHRRTHYLIETEGGVGICQLPSGEINRFPLEELFDPTAVKARAVENKVLESTALVCDKLDSVERMAIHAKEN